MESKPMSRRVYLDHNASTPVHPEVVAEMLPYFTEMYGNPSSIHAFGRERSEEHTSELQSQSNLVCRLLLEKKKKEEVHHLGSLCSNGKNRRDHTPIYFQE